MRKMIGFAVAGAAVALIAAMPVLAHHAFSAEFDANKPLQLKGKVSKVEWINPHAWIHVDVAGADGKTVTWMIEGGTPNTLFRRGFTKNSLQIGTEIIVDGYQAKDGSNKANGRDLTFVRHRRPARRPRRHRTGQVSRLTGYLFEADAA
jgi:hypothetical protein